MTDARFERHKMWVKNKKLEKENAELKEQVAKLSDENRGYCKKCINGDGDGNCIAKEEAPFDSFICENGEMFDPYEENEK